MSDDTVTMSAKVSKDLRDRLDKIGKEMGVSNRSVLLREALESFVEKHRPSGIPTAESEIGDEGEECIGLEEMCGIPQGSGAPSPRNGRGNGRKR